jgi:hypothetical protein
MTCSCSTMCSSSLRRRLLTVRALSQLLVTIDLTVSIKGVAAMDDIWNSLNSNLQAFKVSTGLESAEVALYSFQYSPSGPNPVSGGGTIGLYIDFTISSQLRRLLQLASEDTLNAAVVESLNILLLPLLPSGSEINSRSSASSMSHSVRCNVSIRVDSDLTKSESSVSSFISNDVSGSHSLPQMVSAKSSMKVGYSPGYVPVVWSNGSDDALSEVVNLLPYILGALGGLLLIGGFFGYRYRMVIRSWFESMKDGLSVFNRGNAWNFGRTNYIERGKSEISSTPDTATNIDEDEFDDYILGIRQE